MPSFQQTSNAQRWYYFHNKHERILRSLGTNLINKRRPSPSFFKPQHHRGPPNAASTSFAPRWSLYSTRRSPDAPPSPPIAALPSVIYVLQSNTAKASPTEFTVCNILVPAGPLTFPVCLPLSSVRIDLWWPLLFRPRVSIRRAILLRRSTSWKTQQLKEW